MCQNDKWGGGLMAGKPALKTPGGRTKERETAVVLTNFICLEGKGRRSLQGEEDSGIEVGKG